MKINLSSYLLTLIVTVSAAILPAAALANADKPIEIVNAFPSKIFNPAYSDSDISHFVMVNVYDTLVREGSNSGFTAGIAEKWEISDDNRVFDFWIRDNAQWSDGTKIDAAYVVESFKTLAQLPETPNFLDFNEIDVMLFEKEDGENVVRFVLPKPSSEFLIYLSIIPNAVLPIHKKEVLNFSSPWEHWDNDAFVFSGPYIIDRAQSNAEVLALRPNEAHYGFDDIMNNGVNIHWLVDESHSRHSVAAIKNAEADLALMTNVGIMEFVQEAMEDYVWSIDQLQTELILFNMNSDRVENVEIRQAIASALDVSHAQNFTTSYEVYVTGTFLPGALRESMSLEPDLLDDQPLEDAFSEARAIMRAHGYGPENPLKVNFAINQSALHEAMANLTRSQLAQIYVDAEVHKRPWSEHLKALSAGEFDMARYGWAFDIPHPANLMDIFTTGNPFNYGKYSDEQFDQLIAQMAGAHDAAALRELTVKAEEHLLSQLPAVPIYEHLGELFLARPELIRGDHTFFGTIRFEQIGYPSDTP